MSVHQAGRVKDNDPRQRRSPNKSNAPPRATGVETQVAPLAQSGPGRLTSPAAVLQLQRSIGNRGTTRVLDAAHPVGHPLAAAPQSVIQRVILHGENQTTVETNQITDEGVDQTLLANLASTVQILRYAAQGKLLGSLFTDEMGAQVEFRSPGEGEPEGKHRQGPENWWSLAMLESSGFRDGAKTAALAEAKAKYALLKQHLLGQARAGATLGDYSILSDSDGSDLKDKHATWEEFYEGKEDDLEQMRTSKPEAHGRVFEQQQRSSILGNYLENPAGGSLMGLVETQEGGQEILQGLAHSQVVTYNDKKYLEITDLASAPWNVWPQPADQADARSRRGSGTLIIHELILESMEKGCGGALKLTSAPAATGFYEKMGFEGATSLKILEADKAQALLTRHLG